MVRGQGGGTFQARHMCSGLNHAHLELSNGTLAIDGPHRAVERSHAVCALTVGKSCQDSTLNNAETCTAQTEVRVMMRSPCIRSGSAASTPRSLARIRSCVGNRGEGSTNKKPASRPRKDQTREDCFLHFHESLYSPQAHIICPSL